MPVLKPSEAMIEQAAARGHRIGLLSTFPPTLVSMPREFPSTVRNRAGTGGEARLPGSIAADRAEHDRLVAESLAADLRGCDLIAARANTAWRQPRRWSRRRRPAGIDDAG